MIREIPGRGETPGYDWKRREEERVSVEEAAGTESYAALSRRQEWCIRRQIRLEEDKAVLEARIAEFGRDLAAVERDIEHCEALRKTIEAGLFRAARRSVMC